MQGTHGRDEADAAPLLQRLPPPCAHLLDGVEHGDARCGRWRARRGAGVSSLVRLPPCCSVRVSTGSWLYARSRGRGEGSCWGESVLRGSRDTCGSFGGSSKRRRGLERTFRSGPAAMQATTRFHCIRGRARALAPWQARWPELRTTDQCAARQRRTSRDERSCRRCARRRGWQERHRASMGCLHRLCSRGGRSSTKSTGKRAIQTVRERRRVQAQEYYVRQGWKASLYSTEQQAACNTVPVALSRRRRGCLTAPLFFAVPKKE